MFPLRKFPRLMRWRLNVLATPRGWAAARRAHLKKHPACGACGSLKKVEVHHKKPRHLFPALALDPNNFISLCDPCHFRIGHYNDYRLYNPAVVELCEELKRFKVENPPA